MDKDSKFTRDEDGYVAVRVVAAKEALPASDKDWMFARDENGNIAVRTVGGAGSASLDNVIIKSAEIPAASAAEAGKMYCYDGATSSAYTHGYIYECVAGTPVYSDSVTFEPASLSGTVVTATSGALASLCKEYIHSDITTIVSGTMTYASDADLWSFVGKDAEDNTVGTFQVYTEDYETAGFTFTGAPEDGDVVAFTCTITESSSYSWERIDVQPAAKLGRYLSGWNCATGLAVTNPQESPYEYTTGDYFIVSAVATGGASNYRPNGSSYVVGQASTTVESSVVTINDIYLYDGTNWTLLKTGSTVTSVNGQVGAVTVQDTLVSGTNIKTIDGNSVLGSGDLELSTYLPYPSGWTINSTTKAFCDDIAADTGATVGKAYLGEVTLSDLPASMVNGEIVVEIMSGTTSQDKVIVLTLTSGNTAPYMWKYTYWNGGSDVSGWKGFQEQLVSGTNIKTINGTSLLGSGDITTEAIQVSTMPTASADELGKIYQFIGTTDANYTNGYFYKCVSDGALTPTYSWAQVDVQPAAGPLPSQSGNAGKFLTTDGTDASWSDKPLVNVNPNPNSTGVMIGGTGGTLSSAQNGYICITSFSTYGGWIALGESAIAIGTKNASGYQSISIGGSNSSGRWSICIGQAASSTAECGISIGRNSNVSATNAMQINLSSTTKINSDANTVKIGNDNGNFEIMSADGTIPTDRFTTTPVADGSYVPTLTIASGVATRTWGTAPAAPVVPSTMPELTVADWSSNTQTVNVTGVTASNIVIVSPAPASAADYAAAGIVCTAQGAGTLTFTCTTVPSSAITVNVVIM